eukprot:TRINITY_DN5118_c0_g1_i2.p1 TRINITY_DN5118_c0_g1~~TRINITY_DN5118_c0_g1_i2.p1  ORF type:complete len:283 (-),score=18.19 TRINITY_DN5118_c0_g1_i2:73-921(-)
MSISYLFFIALMLGAYVSLADSDNGTTATYENDMYKVIRFFPRSAPLFYTQGLLFYDDETLLESAGLYGQSEIHLVNLKNMTTTRNFRLSSKYFAEGCDLIYINGEAKIFQLTWQERTIIIYNKQLIPIGQADLPSRIREGWGLAHREDIEDGKKVTNLYVSDGSNEIFVVDPITIKVKKIHKIYLNGKPTNLLNELEFVNNRLYANIYTTSKIAVINLEENKVERLLDFHQLTLKAKQELKLSGMGGKVLNGIAYNPQTKRLIITGKKWPFMAEVQLKYEH